MPSAPKAGMRRLAAFRPPRLQWPTNLHLMEVCGAGILPANCGHARPRSHGRAFAWTAGEQLSGPAWQANRAGAGLVCCFAGGPGCHRVHRRLCGAALPDCGAAESLWCSHGAILLCRAAQKREDGVPLSGSTAGTLRELAIFPFWRRAMLVHQASSGKTHRHLKSEQMKTAEDAKHAEEGIF